MHGKAETESGMKGTNTLLMVVLTLRFRKEMEIEMLKNAQKGLITYGPLKF